MSLLNAKSGRISPASSSHNGLIGTGTAGPPATDSSSKVMTVTGSSMEPSTELVSNGRLSVGVQITYEGRLGCLPKRYLTY